MNIQSIRDQVISLFVKLGGDSETFGFIPGEFKVDIQSMSTGDVIETIKRIDIADNESAEAIRKIKAILK